MLLHMPTRHVLFDLASELLLLLAGRAMPAPMADLASDLGLGGMRALRPYLGILHQRGIDIRMTQGREKGYLAAIAPHCREKAVQMAELYWRCVYEGKTTVAEYQMEQPAPLRPAS